MYGRMPGLHRLERKAGKQALFVARKGKHLGASQLIPDGPGEESSAYGGRPWYQHFLVVLYTATAR